MHNLKPLGLAIAGFALPITLAVAVGPRFFPGGFDPASATSASHTSATKSAGDGDAERLGSSAGSGVIEKSGVFQTVSSDQALDPAAGRYFIVSIQVKLKGFGRSGKRQRLVAKYAADSSPFPGWAIAIRKLNTSTRPEIYWQNRDGKGGWYTFEHMRFLRNRWYTLTLIARDQDLLSLYVEESSESGETSEAVSDDDPEFDTNTVSAEGVRFLGGYNIGEMQIVPTSASLEFAPRSSDSSDFRGEVRNLLIARPERVPPKQSRLMELVQGGAPQISTRLSEEDISLWVDDNGLDRSRSQRSVSLATEHS